MQQHKIIYVSLMAECIQMKRLQIFTDSLEVLFLCYIVKFCLAFEKGDQTILQFRYRWTSSARIMSENICNLSVQVLQTTWIVLKLNFFLRA